MLKDVALRLIERVSTYLEKPPQGFSNFDFWVQSEEETNPGVREVLRLVALPLLSSPDRRLSRTAVHALACVGTKEDIRPLAAFGDTSGEPLQSEVLAAIAHLETRSKSVEELLEEVNCQESFVVFVRALAKERESAEKIEAGEPNRYRIDGALGWKNADIPSFLYAALSLVEGSDTPQAPSWKIFAEFLYQGKVYE